MSETPEIMRQQMEVDIACVGFGPAMGGFLTTLGRAMMDENGQPVLPSSVAPGMPPQVVCYERAEDISFGVSGVVTRGRGIRRVFPQLDLTQIPMAHPVTEEKVLYLLDPIGASRRSGMLKLGDWLLKAFSWMLPVKEDAFELPYIPDFMKKHDGFILSLGQFNQWVGSQIMASGAVQIWPNMPVEGPVIENNRVTGVRLVDQGVDKSGNPEAGAYMPGMDIKAKLTVVGDGPIGAVGQKLNEHFGLPEGHHQRDWAVGMKMVVKLPENSPLKPGTVLHTFGFPEPEIFGFLYVYQDGLASLGIFVPTWFDSPVRTSYRYLQHWMMHPYLWRYLKDAVMQSWGAKSLQESGRRGEPHLVGDGYARIGEGSGSTNVLTGSGVDEAWETGIQLAEGVIELMKEGKDFTKENLESAYVQRRRKSWVEKEGRIAEKARDGFQNSFLSGLIGMGLSGLSNGKINISGPLKKPFERIPALEEYYQGIVSKEELQQIREQAQKSGTPLRDILMEKSGWPKIPYDGKLLMSHQDALLLGGKVQAPSGYADHVVFLYPYLCESCGTKICIELCSGQAITPGESGGVPQFDREKCVHCGACLWNCARARDKKSESGNIIFKAGAGGLHSAQN